MSADILNLAAITQRAQMVPVCDLRVQCAPWGGTGAAQHLIREDVPALVAEVQRMREVLEQLLCFTCRGHGVVLGERATPCAVCDGAGTYGALAYP